MNESLVRSNDKKINESIDYMMLHFDRPLKVKELAEITGCSLPNFFLIFKRKTGYSPINYLIRLRMRRACFFLETTNMNIKNIAYTLGYKCPLYFSRLFKLINKMSPLAYRAKLKYFLPVVPGLVRDNRFPRIEGCRRGKTFKTNRSYF
jgi:transcriptional regulator GlxA family with amidase domain